MNNTKTIFAFKHTIYTLLLLLLYVVQTVPGLLAIHGVRPIWVVPAAVAIAMFEGEFVGGIYGAAAGLLCDISGLSLFGFNGFFIALFCIAAGLMVIYLLRCNLLGCLLFVFVTLLVRGSVEYLFAYGIWGYDNVWKLYVYSTLPTVVYSVAVTAPVFWLARWLFRKFEPVLKH